MRTLIIIWLLSLSAIYSFGQRTADSIPAPKKQFAQAAVQIVISELLPWSYNRFIRKAEFAKVNFKSIGNNLKPSSWEWDDNSFKTNQLAHPYHGNLFYSSLRSNGYNFWQSASAAFAGSLLWEIAGETHLPAPNDFINTGLGGVALGEMSYRVSRHIVNNRVTGPRRQLQEILALLVNPMNGLTKLTRGEWGKVHGVADTSGGVTADLNVGVRRFGIQTSDQRTRGHNELYLRVKLNYGKKYHPSQAPFESFLAQIEAGSGDSTYLNNVQVIGALKTWKMREEGSHSHFYSVTMNYNYIKVGAFQYGGQSFTFRLLSQWNKNSRTKISTEIGSGVTVLAAVPDKYLFYGEGRNYDYGPGIHVIANTRINFNEYVDIELNYLGSRFKTINGNKSSYILNTLSADVNAKVLDRFSVAAGVGQYTLNGFYDNLSNVAQIFPFARFSLGYRL
ncbi:DUF3943 domain-containing protein [Arcticibacter sp.]|uniref:DUF3943 domain-containing protein n=1 Tax=Arcticibacter sp. TaxID=1872630 RepID=UPI00388F6466